MEGVLLGESMTNEMREAFEAFLADYTFGSSEKEIVLNMIKDSYRFLVTSAHFMVQNWGELDDKNNPQKTTSQSNTWAGWVGLC